MLIHALLLLCLALWFQLAERPGREAAVLTLTSYPRDALDVGDLAAVDFRSPGGSPASPTQAASVVIDTPRAATHSIDTFPVVPQQSMVSSRVLPQADWLAPSGMPTGGGLEGRSAGLKGRLLGARGGNRDSEAAVSRGLRWLAAHQRADGSWWCNHQDGPCQSLCRNPGDFASTTASTALALLPFYGAGHTHRAGDFQEVVGSGLFYLGSQMIATPHGGDLQQGSMYGQGLAAIVLCEAYAMTGDENLHDFAQAEIDFIVHAQHVEGGWRYVPGQPGDTTVTGWQLMALKSAQMAKLDAPFDAVYRVTHFLDRVEADDGARYGYQNTTARQATTAVGLYCRMLAGWNRQHPSLQRGVAYLAELGPSPSDMYYNYYATQVLNHFDGPLWKRWNRQMRDQLLRDQASRGHEAGSWFYEHPHSAAGGRLFHTTLALMTLEVYYRYMPLYGTSVIDDF